MTVKQRQEFRIRLQKRARRIAEKKLETSEEEKIDRIVSTVSCTRTERKAYKSIHKGI